METRYFEYSTNRSKGKYMEVSEHQFIDDVMKSDDRYYIPMGNVVFEASESEYRKYRTERNRHYHLRQIQKEESITLVSLSDLEKMPDDDCNEDTIIDSAAMSVRLEQLASAMQKLSTDEQQLIYWYYYQEFSQEQIAVLTGKRQQTISRKLHNALYKLAELMKKSKNK